jgi:hypothetical protein
MTDQPIACALDHTQAAARHDAISRLWADALIASEWTRAGMRARLRDTPHIERRARELIEAESRCCPFLAFDLARDDGELLLEIKGPVDARPVIESFFERAKG